MHRVILLFVMLLSHFNLAAQDRLQLEINHLLNFVEGSECHYIRNGRSYSAEEAVAHINKKYNYYKDDINTAEQFIEFAASKSMLSGKRYMIQCGNDPLQPSQRWLQDELERFRLQ